MILPVLILLVAGWIQCHQQRVITSLREENLVLKAQLGWRVQIAGITPHPTMTFMQQCSRELTNSFDGFLHGKRYLVHDRDTKYTQAFDPLLRDSDVKPIVLPPPSPNLNAHCERFVRSVREEVLQHTIIMGEESLRVVLTQYLAHDHAERNQQGLDDQLLAPASDFGSCSGHVRRLARLGGLLSHYYRDAA